MKAWRKMTWAIVAWSTVTWAFAIVPGAISTLYGFVTEGLAGVAAGWLITLALAVPVFAVWFLPFVALALIWMMTKPTT